VFVREMHEKQRGATIDATLAKVRGFSSGDISVPAPKGLWKMESRLRQSPKPKFGPCRPAQIC
jgi:hypothetical protein